MTVQIQLRRGTAAEWTAANPILALGELGLEIDTMQFKIGDGVTAWSGLAYGIEGPAGAAGADGAPGAPGEGVPVGGAAGEVLAKIDATDFNTEWVPQSGGGGGVSTPDYEYYRDIGSYHLAGQKIAGNSTSVSHSQNVLRAIPFISPRGGTVNSLGCLATTSSSNMRMGIYEATSATDIYPGALLIDAGAGVVTSSGLDLAISQALEPDKLYWIAALNQPNITLWSLFSGQMHQIPAAAAAAGFSAAYGNYLTIAQAYGALPNPFPGGAGFALGTVMMMGVRFSSW